MGDILSRFIADPMVSTIITAIAAGLIALWLLASLWVHADAEHRTGSEVAALAAAAWMLLSTPLMLPLSLAAYAFVRPPEPLAERRYREITARMVADSLAADACGGCGAMVDAAWRRCPTCSSWLAAPCADCERWSAVALDACPWCGGIEHDEPTVDGPAEVSAAPFIDLPAARVPVLVTASKAAGDGRSALLETGLLARSAGRRSASPSHDRPAAVAGDGASRRPRLRSGRMQRRAPGVAVARSLERGSSGGQSGARSRS